jgi:hypothetical protein
MPPSLDGLILEGTLFEGLILEGTLFEGSLLCKSPAGGD